MSKQLKDFNIMAKVTIDTTLTIRAKDLDDAVEIGKSLREVDFVDIKGDFIDGDLKVYGAYEVE